MSASAPRVLLFGFGAIGRQLVSLLDPSEFEVSAFVTVLIRRKAYLRKSSTTLIHQKKVAEMPSIG